MHLWAMVNDNTGRLVEGAECFWFMDGKKVAEGKDAWVIAPAAGKHTCLLKVNIDDDIEYKAGFETIMLDGLSK